MAMQDDPTVGPGNETSGQQDDQRHSMRLSIKILVGPGVRPSQQGTPLEVLAEPRRMT